MVIVYDIDFNTATEYGISAKGLYFTNIFTQVDILRKIEVRNKVNITSCVVFVIDTNLKVKSKYYFSLPTTGTMGILSNLDIPVTIGDGIGITSLDGSKYPFPIIKNTRTSSLLGGFLTGVDTSVNFQITKDYDSSVINICGHMRLTTGDISSIIPPQTIGGF